MKKRIKGIKVKFSRKQRKKTIKIPISGRKLEGKKRGKRVLVIISARRSRRKVKIKEISWPLRE